MAGQQQQADVAFNIQWLKDMRHALGWSTTDVAKRARERAAELGDPISISQQLVSRFENGHHKSSPRWLGYVQNAMEQEMAGRTMEVGRLFELRLPSAVSQFFQGGSGWRGPPQRSAETLEQVQDPDEREWIEHFRRLSPHVRRTALDLIRSLPDAGAATVHTPRPAYRAEPKRPGREGGKR